MRPGERIGRYVVRGFLGQGGMGQVYRAYDEVLDRPVALKLLRETGGDEAQGRDSAPTVKRIVREARNAAALAHANVVAIYDVGEHQGVPFLVMELVHGRSLRSLVATDAKVEDRLRWLIDVARALAAAHRIGLVHRDIKPDNVLVNDEGVVKVLDFGIARRTEDAARTESEAPPSAANPLGATAGRSLLAGTPGYMAPELLSGRPTDARVDQFAWGVMAFELLTGSWPWPEESGRLLQAVLAEEPRTLDTEAIGVGDEVAAVVARSLRKRPEDRFPTMDALLSALGVSPQGESGRRVATDPAATELASAPTVRASTTAPGELTPSVTPRPPSRARAAWAAGLVALGLGATFAWKKAVLPGAPPSAPAVTADAATFAVLSPSGARRLTFDPGCEEFPALSPDGTKLYFDAVFATDTHVVELDLATGERRTLTHDKGWQYAPQVSADGRLVAFLSDTSGRTGSYTAPVDGSAPPSLVHLGQTRPTFSPDGAALWTGNGLTVDRVDLGRREPTRTLKAPEGRALTQVLEVTGGAVFARVLSTDTGRGVGLLRYDPDREAPVEIFAGDIEEALALAPDGQRVLFSPVLPTHALELWQAPLASGPPSLAERRLP